MPEESNGHESPSRLDRIERAVEALIDDHERLRDSQKDLLRAQVILVDNVDKLVKKVDDHEDRIKALVDSQLRLDDAMTESRRQFEDFVQWAKRILDRLPPAV
jgi:peptidoglycan hydrolase CwlO-like protein